MRIETQRKFLARAVGNVLLQGEKAYNVSSGACKYRIERDGKKLKCAIGGLINDENYTDELETQALCGADNAIILSVYHSNQDFFEPGEFRDFSKRATAFFGAIQAAHDDCHSGVTFVTDFMAKVAGVARRVEEGEFQYNVGSTLKDDWFDLELPLNVRHIEVETTMGGKVVKMIDAARKLIHQCNESGVPEIIRGTRLAVIAMVDFYDGE